MTAGYSGTPLARKLGIKPGMKVVTLGAPEDYRELLEPLPDGVMLTDKLIVGATFIHLFTKERAQLETELPRLKRALDRDGTIWLSWPKKASKIETDLDGNIVRSLGLRAGLVDVKICAIDLVWSGLKFVYRLRDR